MHRVICASCFVMILGSLLLTQISFSQRGLRGQARNSPEMLEAMTDTLISRLELTKEQIPAVRAILTTRAESLMALRPKPGGSHEQFQAIRAKRQEINEEAETALAVLLSTEQMMSYRMFIERQGPRRGLRMRRRSEQDRP